jgi:adenylate kinase
MLNIVLFGPPGAGKGTQSQKIIDQYNLTHISTGDMFRKHMGEGTELGKKAKQYMDSGQLVPDELVIDMVDHQLDESNKAGSPPRGGVIFDGFPRTIPQAKALDDFLQSKGTSITCMIALEVPDEELKKRILERGKVSGRSDDQNEEKINIRLMVYRKATLPVADYYRKQEKYASVNGVGSIEDIFNRITAEIEKFK